MKESNEKINSFSLSTLVITLSGAPFWGILTSYLLYNSREATPISMIIGYILGLLISKTILTLNDKHTNLISSLTLKPFLEERKAEVKTYQKHIMTILKKT